jgi:hypothetical protein
VLKQEFPGSRLEFASVCVCRDAHKTAPVSCQWPEFVPPPWPVMPVSQSGVIAAALQSRCAADLPLVDNRRSAFGNLTSPPG